MQDRFDSFDQEIRSMMQDVEVKPSRHVWKAVSARIAAPKAIWGGWNTVKWAGAGLAFAAAIALGVFFTGSHDKSGVISTSDLKIAEVQEPVQLIKSEEPKLEATAITYTSRRPKVSSLTEEKTNIIPSEAVSGSAEPDSPAVASQVQTPEQKEEVIIEQFSDPFALLTSQEEKEEAVKYATLEDLQDAINDIDLSDIQDFKDELKEFNIDTLVLDPPRSGSDKKSLRALLKIKPKEIIYE